jgi:nitrate/nitrite transport system substrate-binding protein
MGMVAVAPKLGVLGAAKKPPAKPGKPGVASTTVAAAPTTTVAAKKTDTKVKLGFIALTDCAPIIMAKELGYFAQRGLDVSVEKQASWPALRDAVLNNQIDGAHALFGMPFSVASGIGGSGSTALKIAMMLNQNGQGITLENGFKEVGYGNIEAAGEMLRAKSPTLAMTFPGGTHDIWLRYWLKACKVDTAKLKIIAVPPPQMVANMKSNNMDGYCVGEPWNAQAVFDKVGFTHLATQDIWTGHPEKCLMVNEKFAAERKDVLKQVMGAILQASKWLDEPTNRAGVAETLAKPAYVNTQANTIRNRLIGQYDLGGGLGLKEFAGDQMQFFQGGTVSFPRRSHATWFLAQYERLGIAKGTPDYANLPSKLILSDLYAEVAAAEKVPVPADDMSPFDVKLDGATFDPKKPQAEATRS